MKTPIKFTILLFFSTFELFLTGINCGLQQYATVNMEMEKSGMHRKLRYTVRFDSTIADQKCEFIIAQDLPAAVYVSTDELDDLQRLRMISAVYPEFVDVEIMTENAEPFSVLLRGSTKSTEPITLPIHFRYHAASRKRTTARVVIGAPRLYLSCPVGDKQSIELPLLHDNKVYCLNERKANFQEQIKPGDCNWLRVKLKEDENLFAEIPVGDARGYTPVLYATIILSWVAGILIILRSWPTVRRINKFSDEHVLLQEAKIK